MDHRPYETWLLDDERLNAEQERDLRTHLRNCPQCSAQARANMALRSAPMSGPAPGFVARFQVRLVAERQVQRRRNLFGWALLILVGMGALLMLLAPYFAYFSSPSQAVTIGMSNLMSLGLTLHALGLIGNALINVLASFVPPYVWMGLFALLGSAGFLWVFAFRRYGRISQSAAYRLKEQ